VWPHGPSQNSAGRSTERSSLATSPTRLKIRSRRVLVSEANESREVAAVRASHGRATYRRLPAVHAFKSHPSHCETRSPRLDTVNGTRAVNWWPRGPSQNSAGRSTERSSLAILRSSSRDRLDSRSLSVSRVCRRLCPRARPRRDRRR
jgi:hypothetical protein